MMQLNRRSRYHHVLNPGGEQECHPSWCYAPRRKKMTVHGIAPLELFVDDPEEPQNLRLLPIQHRQSALQLRKWLQLLVL